MDTSSEQVVGIAFLCDMHGRLIRLLRDDLDLSEKLKLGQPFTMVFETENIRKAFQFLAEVRSKGTAFDWELCVNLDKGCEVLHFAGYSQSEHIFVVGSRTRSGVIFFCDELMKISNEQAAEVRMLMKEQIMSSRENSEKEKNYYEELTRLNNELEIAQRQLEKKNIALEAAFRQLEETRNQLIQSEKMASLGRLVSGFAHEINTPIGIAVTASSTLNDAQQNIRQMLSQEEVDEEELVGNLETIREGAELTLVNLKRAAELISSFKRTSVDQSAETPRLFDMNEVIHDVILSLHSKFRTTKITFSTECSKPLNIFGYPGAVSQILANFMINSLIYGFDDGRLPGQISITAFRKKDTICLDYEDNGQGMEPAIVAKIFEPFFTTRRARGGTGLGLYICYNIVTDRLKGTIDCESRIGHGTIFHIRFPLEKFTEPD